MFCKVICRSALKAVVKKDQNWKQAFWETAFRGVNATHRVTRLYSVFSLLTQFSGNLQWDTSVRNEAHGDKGSILRWKLERSFVRNFLLMCEFMSQSYTYVSCSSPLSVFLKHLRRTSLNRIEACGDKGNIISSNRERSFLRNFFLLSEFLSQSYCLVSGSSLLTLFSWNLQSVIWEPIGSHGEKGYIFI